jgi:hypothetical protein
MSVVFARYHHPPPGLIALQLNFHRRLLTQQNLKEKPQRSSVRGDLTLVESCHPMVAKREIAKRTPSPGVVMMMRNVRMRAWIETIAAAIRDPFRGHPDLAWLNRAQQREIGEVPSKSRSLPADGKRDRHGVY